MTDRTLNRELLVPGSEERAALPRYKPTGENMDLAPAAWERGIAAFRPDPSTNEREEQPR